MTLLQKIFGSFERLSWKTFVVILRLETRMSIRLMELLNCSKEQHNSPSTLSEVTRIKRVEE